MTTARSIIKMTTGKSITDGYAIVSEEITNSLHDTIDNYEKESTMYRFTDGSMILLCSKDFSIKVLYYSTLPVWAK